MTWTVYNEAQGVCKDSASDGKPFSLGLVGAAYGICFVGQKRQWEGEARCVQKQE